MSLASLVIPAKFLERMVELEYNAPFVLMYNPVEDDNPREDDWEAFFGEEEAFGLTPAQAFGNLMAKLFPPPEDPTKEE